MPCSSTLKECVPAPNGHFINANARANVKNVHALMEYYETLEDQERAKEQPTNAIKETNSKESKEALKEKIAIAPEIAMQTGIIRFIATFIEFRCTRMKSAAIPAIASAAAKYWME